MKQAMNIHQTYYGVRIQKQIHDGSHKHDYTSISSIVYGRNSNDKGRSMSYLSMAKDTSKRLIPIYTLMVYGSEIHLRIHNDGFIAYDTLTKKPQ